MKLFGKKRIRRRELRRIVWIAITALATFAMVFATYGSVFNK